MAAAAHVVRAAPVDELVARRAREQDVAGLDAGQGGPQPAERVRVGAAVHPAVARAQPEHGRVALHAPGAAAVVGQVTSGGEAQLALGRPDRGLPVQAPAHQVDAVDVGEVLDQVGGGLLALLLVERVDHRRPGGRADRHLGLVGRHIGGREQAPGDSTSARFTRASTGICEWSDMTITAWSSRNASGPPAGSMSWASARSASAIEAHLLGRAVAVREGVVVGQREEQEVEQVVLDELSPRSRCGGRAGRACRAWPAVGAAESNRSA